MTTEPISQIAENLARIAEHITSAPDQLIPTIAAPLLTALFGLLAAYAFSRLSHHHQKRERRRLMAAAIAAELDGWHTICVARDYDAYGQSLLDTLTAGSDIVMPRLVDARLSPIQTANATFPLINRNLDDIGLLGGDVTCELARFLSLHQGLTVDLISYAQGKWDHASVLQKTESIRENLGLFRQCVQLANSLIPKLQAMAK